MTTKQSKHDNGNTDWPYHENKNTGELVKCKSNPCTLHGEGEDVHASSIEEAYEKLHERDDARGINKENDEPREYMNTERIETLLTEHIPMNDDRKGSVPVLTDSDIPVTGVRKLGRYIARNFNGDAVETSLAALRTVYDNDSIVRTVDDIPDSVGDFAQRISRETGADAAVYRDDGGTFYIVGQGKLVRDTMMSGCEFRKSHIDTNAINFGQLMATREVMNGIDFSVEPNDGARAALRAGVVNDLLNVNKRPYNLVNSGISSLDRIPSLARNYDINMDNSLESLNTDNMSAHDRIAKIDSTLNDFKNNPIPRSDAYLRDIQSRAIWGLQHERRQIITNQLRIAPTIMNNLTDTLNDERNGEMNRKYAITANRGHSATVFEDKKNRDDAHITMGNRSSFRKDFRYIEVDDSVDTKKFDQISKEYDRYRDLLPKARVPASFRFRKTGRHHATGVYTPAFRNISVDPRSPSSFTHEFMHHYDFTTSEHGQLSMRPEFRSIVRDYQENIDRSQIQGKVENYTAPTEIFARAGELWMHWKHENMNSSFIDTDEHYNNGFDYAPLLKHREEIMSFFDNLTK